jgi:hypothetical protein
MTTPPPPNTLAAFLATYVPHAMPKAPANERSSSKTTTPAYPRTDLREFLPWTDFKHVVDSHREQWRTIPFDFPVASSRQLAVACDESTVVSNTNLLIFICLRDALAALDYPSDFKPISGCSSLVGEPDRVLRPLNHGTAGQPTLTIEFKTPWALSISSEDLIPSWNRSHNQPSSVVRKAVGQIYGYMTFNHHRYGILTTYDSTWFLQRQSSSEGGVLLVKGFSRDSTDPFTLMEAYVAFCQEVYNNWFYVSPVTSPAPPRGSTETTQPFDQLAQNLFDLLGPITVGMDAIIFEKGRDQSYMGSVVTGRLFNIPVIFKVADVSKRHSLLESMQHEVAMYRNMMTLQGITIPIFHGYVKLWDMLVLIAVSDCG